MAELILTEKERKSTWAEADELALGKAVKYVAFQMGLANDNSNYPPAILTACAQHLIVMLQEVNADKGTFKIENLTYKHDKLGDWKITIKKVKKAQEES